MCMTWLIFMCDMTHSALQNSPARQTWLIFMCVTWQHSFSRQKSVMSLAQTRLRERHDSFLSVTWLIHTCDMTRSYEWHDSFICMWHKNCVWHEETRLRERHDSFLCFPSLIWHDIFCCLTWPILVRTYESVMSLAQTRLRTLFKICVHVHVYIYGHKHMWIYLYTCARDMTHYCVFHDSFDMTYFVFWHHSFLRKHEISDASPTNSPVRAIQNLCTCTHVHIRT